MRRLPAVETLGSVARICSDKTGTLTLMEMMVVSAVTAGDALNVTGDGYANEGQVLKDGAPVGTSPTLELLGRVSALCNDSELRKVDGVWEGRGRSDRGRALSVRREARNSTGRKEQAAYPRIDAIPFESEHRFMATLHKAPEGNEILLVKGAPEAILDACDRQQDAAAKSRSIAPAFETGVRRARGTRRACAGARVAARSRRQGRQPRPGRSAERTSCCSASSASSIRRARKRSKR